MHSALKEAKSCEADETDSLRNKQGTGGGGVETEGWEKVEEAVETQARDIHIEYKNNRSLNTNNRKVLRVSTSFEKVERNKDRLLKGGFLGGGPLSGGPRHSPFGCGLDLTERESIGYPWPAPARARRRGSLSYIRHPGGYPARGGVEVPKIKPFEVQINSWPGAVRILHSFVTNVISKS